MKKQGQADHHHDLEQSLKQEGVEPIEVHALDLPRADGLPATQLHEHHEGDN